MERPTTAANKDHDGKKAVNGERTDIDVREFATADPHVVKVKIWNGQNGLQNGLSGQHANGGRSSRASSRRSFRDDPRIRPRSSGRGERGNQRHWEGDPRDMLFV